ncbi:redoxin domain-containing protein [Pedobacter polaris]|uniref:Redoxin domain-containing protein n=1 Tax=Pedobacter polaris TaxID=2571273 RepID=A0A4U1CVG5_9SPHI|nr:TlpA disulfide reductase family protein [Pedobacter polaris]TKC09898.1 redoxin domain-containing protein [Pedobacter polaris]
MKIIIRIVLSMLFCISWNANAQNLEAMRNQIQSMIKETDPEKNVLSLHKIIKDYNLDTIENAEDIDLMKGMVALNFLNVKVFPQFENYIKSIKNKFNQTSYLNMAADILNRDNVHLDYAEVIAKKTVELYDSYKNDPSARPNNFPEESWNKFMKMAAYPYYETYAKTLYANGKNHAAFLYLEKAWKSTDMEEIQQTSVELYTKLLELEGQEPKAYEILLKMAELGKSSTNMNTQLKRLYVKNGGSKANGANFLDSIQRNVNKAYKIEMAKKMIADVEAPNFTLFDLSGKRVSLLDLRGKIVVLDFWATWCVPCIASMPAMKKVSSQHPEVIFLFIATQESGPSAEERVKSYIKKYKFPNNVLMDKPSAKNPKIFPTAVAYNIKGIPAKMVIDKNGRLRFSTSGYSSDAELINELEAMIAIAKAQ